MLHFSGYCEKSSEDGKVESYVFFLSPVQISGGNIQVLMSEVDAALDRAFSRFNKWGVEL